jgi:hypothetical protein
MDPLVDGEGDERGETYHVLPNVLLPLDSARRKN